MATNQISIGGIGKKVICTPNVEPDIKILCKAARKGYCYPTIALKQLESPVFSMKKLF